MYYDMYAHLLEVAAYIYNPKENYQSCQNASKGVEKDFHG